MLCTSLLLVKKYSQFFHGKYEVRTDLPLPVQSNIDLLHHIEYYQASLADDQ